MWITVCRRPAPHLHLKRSLTRDHTADMLHLGRFEIYYSCPAMTQFPMVADSSPAEQLVRRGLAALVHYDASRCDPWDLQARVYAHTNISICVIYI